MVRNKAVHPFPFQIRGILVKKYKDFKGLNCTSVPQLHNKGKTNNNLNKPGLIISSYRSFLSEVLILT